MDAWDPEKSFAKMMDRSVGYNMAEIHKVRVHINMETEDEIKNNLNLLELFD